ncbi:hypothetical protein BFX40_32475 [Mesorhizobium sp. SEMIA 3007]|uniref:hypothetical protein n=1 Tax=unclassified Mesorhizobium TaxID=325217 RepID=UPI00083DBAC8|nr:MULTISPECIES: hypothetical protein [unclassified Mesorhizobium]ODA97102.1 hypothetical protein BFX40_32475 [Mesorhizobium sp. SEMIA 3007]BCH07710.1 hypothetical protein MesoLj131c_19680 [Mesorhizobium sp. 131-3-5]
MMYTLEQNGRGAMADLMILELAKARQRVKRAEVTLRRAKEMLDEDCGVGINIALCGRIRAAQRRVIEARERLTKIDPAAL